MTGAGPTEPARSGVAGFAGVEEWEPVIGLEIHVQLKTRTKMFCRCANGFGGGENTQVCPVCLGFPGALPVPNRTAIEWTIKLGLAFGCQIAERAVFSRKSYVYPDLPKGYQISQYDLPSCISGSMLVPGLEGDREVGIVRAHLEEDAAKTTHVGGRTGRIGGASTSLVDFNRGGTPLVEIVTGPDLHSAEDARRFLQLLRQTIVELGVSDAEMEKGTLRVDANVSIRPRGSQELRTRCELKNMNSFRFVAQGIDAEVARQTAVYEAGGAVVQETYDFDASSGALTARRSKEEADDYRYFPEPDLVPVEPSADLVDRLRTELPELPGARIRRLERELDLDRATVLVTGGLDGLYEATVAAGAERLAAANLIANRLADSDPGAIAPGELAKLVEARDRIPRSALDEALWKLAEPGFSADPFLAQEAVSDTRALEPIVDRILQENAGQVEAYRSGKEGLLGFFVGQVMKETSGKANPRVVSELVRERIRA